MSSPRSIFDIRDDPTDYKTELAIAIGNGASDDEKTVLKGLIATKRLATGVAAQLDDTFKALMRKSKNGT